MAAVAEEEPRRQILVSSAVLFFFPQSAVMFGSWINSYISYSVALACRCNPLRALSLFTESGCPGS